MAKSLARAACGFTSILVSTMGLVQGCTASGAGVSTPELGGNSATSGGASTGTQPGNGGGPLSAQGGQGIFIGTGGSNSGTVQACASQNTPAEPAPLDIYIMLDISGSMLDKTSSGITKWDAITSAITSFLQNGSADDISVGIQYFPLKKAGVPARCSSDAECGKGGLCALKWCNAYARFVPNGMAVCQTDSDCSSIPTIVDYGSCTAGKCSADATKTCSDDAACQITNAFSFGPCVAIGNCSLAPTIACTPGQACGMGPDGSDRGTCVGATSSFCFHGTECAATAYASPAVEIASIPGATDALTASLASQVPEGDTPSGAALRGAIEHARKWATDHRGHTVVAVLATDGLPTECLPDNVRFTGTLSPEALIGEVEAVAADGFHSTPAIPTFVIGVFAGTDTAAPANLERIARAGGSQTAQMVDTAGDVSQQFLSALNAVRSSQLSCEFQIPSPSGGGRLDYFEVNVLHVDGDVSEPLGYVGTPERCDSVKGGWYYDDLKGTAPTKILVCPSNCEAFKVASGSLQIQLGCDTIIY